MSKLQAFEPMDAFLDQKLKELKYFSKIKIVGVNFNGFQATLQPTKSFLHPSNLFN